MRRRSREYNGFIPNRKGFIRNEPICWFAEPSRQSPDYIDLMAIVEVRDVTFKASSQILKWIYREAANADQLVLHTLAQLENDLRAQVRTRLGHRSRLEDLTHA